MDRTEWTDGSWYKGSVLDDGAAVGVRNGHVTCIYPDGTPYHGEWKDDKRNGLGVLTSDFRISRGIFRLGRRKLRNFNY